MQTTISFVAEKRLSDAIGRVVVQSGFYQSKSEFVRDAVREKLFRFLDFEKELTAVHASRKRLQAKAKFKGELSVGERDRLAREFLKTRQE